MIAARSRRALVALILLLGRPSWNVPRPSTRSEARRSDPFCIGVTDTWVEACVGSLYDTVAALTQMVGMGMPHLGPVSPGRGSAPLR